MHQFLDQLLNNPPAKKRTQTQTSSEIVKRNSQHERLQQLIELQRKDSQPGLYSSEQYQNTVVKQQNSSMSQGTNWKPPQDQSQEYEVEEVTEQIVFDDDGAKTTAQKLQGFLPKVKESLPQLQASHQQQQQVYQVLQVYSPSLYQHPQPLQQPSNPSNPTRNYYSHASNRRISTQPQEPIPHNWPSSKLMQSQVQNFNPSMRSIVDRDQRTSMINIRTVENLINGINNARECQMELMKWFELEKQCFGEFINIVMVKVQLQVKKVLERRNMTSVDNRTREQLQQTVREQMRSSIKQQLTSTLRQQLQLQYQQRLQQQKSLLQSQPSQRHQSSQSSLNTQRKWQIQKKLIKQQLQQRYQYRLQKLQQELDEQRKYSQELIKTYQDTHKQSSVKSSRSILNNGKVSSTIQLEEQLGFVKKQLQDRDKTINELEIQIQRLNEHIFDVEQKVQGIELQVQNRVRQKVKLLQTQHQKALLQPRNPHTNSPCHGQSSPITELNPILQHSSHLQQSSRLFGLQSTHHLHQQITELQLQNQQLKKIIMELEHQKNSIEQQLKQQDKIIVFREQQVKKNQQDIAYEWAQVDKERQTNLSRQQELATAEDNISRKISQLRTKQIDLDRWQTQLQKRQLALDLRQNEINQKLQEIVHQSNIAKEHQNTFNQKDHIITRNERQSISTNQNRQSRQNINHFYNEGSAGHGSFRPNGVDIPELPIGKNYTHEHQNIIKHEKSFDHDFNYRSTKPQQLLSKANFEKSFEDADRSYTRQNRSRERMIITSTNFRSNRATNPNTHQFILPQNQNPKAQRHSRSKSRSNEKPMLRNNLVNGSSSISTNTYKNPSFKGKYIDEYYQNKQTSNLDGLGSKLERLRDEIKREIDSIK